MDTRAQSETMGVVLIALLVVLATATVGVLLFQKQQQTLSAQPPQVAFTTDLNASNIKLTHTGGAGLPLADLHLVVRTTATERTYALADPADRNTSYGDGDGTFEFGEWILVDHAFTNEVRLLVVDTSHHGHVLSDETTEVPGGGSGTPTIERFDVVDTSAGGNASYEVTWNATDAQGDIIEATVELINQNSGTVEDSATTTFNTVASTGDQTDTLTNDSGAGETYKITLTVTDASGNSKTTTTVDTADVKRVGFPRVAFVADGRLQAMDAEGRIANYAPAGSEVAALGPPNTDITDNGSEDVPYVTSSDTLKIVDTENNTHVLHQGTNNQFADTRMGVGVWDDGAGSIAPKVVYVYNGILYSANTSTTSGLSCSSCPGNNYSAGAVADVRDFTGDGNIDIIYVKDTGGAGQGNAPNGGAASTNLSYISEEEDSPTDTGYTVDTPNAVSTAADFDNDDTIEVASVTSNGNITLVTASGAETTRYLPYDVSAVPMGVLDWTGDGVPDVIHVRADTGELAYYDVVHDQAGVVTDSTGTPVTPASGPGVV